jgi:hypothetical protein
MTFQILELFYSHFIENIFVMESILYSCPIFEKFIFGNIFSITTCVFFSVLVFCHLLSDQLNEEFFQNVLQLIENPPSLQFEDSAVDLLIAFILSFNLHLTSVETNIVLKSLAAFGTPKVFMEHTMMLINRGGGCSCCLLVVSVTIYHDQMSNDTSCEEMVNL